MKNKYRIMHILIMLTSTMFDANGQVPSEIDVFVFYTANAKIWIEGTGFDAKKDNVATFIGNEIIANANNSLYLADVNTNSKVNIKLNMVGTELYTLTERKTPVNTKTSVIESDLHKFRKDPIVHRKRLDSKADVVLLIGEWPNAKIANSQYLEAGLHIGTNVSKKNVQTAGLCPNSNNICFAVNIAMYENKTKKLLTNTFLHELGHALGLDHSKEDILKDDWADAGMNEYAHGYQVKNDKGVIIGNDIMGYQTYAQPKDPDALIGFVKSQVPLYTSIATTSQEIYKITENMDFYSQYNLQLPALGTVNDPDGFHANAVKVLNDNAQKYASFYPDVLTKSCSGLNKEAIHSDDFDVICGESSNGTAVCIGNKSNIFMKSAINRNFDNNVTYSLLQNYKYLDRHLPLNEDDRPIGVLCKKLQTCVFQISNSGIQGEKNVIINFLLSNAPSNTTSPPSLLDRRTSKKLFTVKCFVDDYLIADPVIIQPKDVIFQGNGETFESSIEIPTYLKVTDKKIQVLVIAEDFDADNINTVLSIKSIKIGPYSYDSDDGQNSTNSGSSSGSSGSSSSTVSTTTQSVEPQINGNTVKIFFNDRSLFKEDLFVDLIPAGVVPGYTGLVKINWGDGTSSREIGIGDVSITSTASMALDYLQIASTYIETKDIKERGYIEHTYSKPGAYIISVEGQRRTYNWICKYSWINWLTLNPLPNCGYQAHYPWYNVGQRTINITSNTISFAYKQIGSLNVQFIPNALLQSQESNLLLVWDFGDGTTAIGGQPVHYYKKPGTYIVTVTGKVKLFPSIAIFSITSSIKITSDITPILNLLLD